MEMREVIMFYALTLFIGKDYAFPDTAGVWRYACGVCRYMPIANTQLAAKVWQRLSKQIVVFAVSGHVVHAHSFWALTWAPAAPAPAICRDKCIDKRYLSHRSDTSRQINTAQL